MTAAFEWGKRTYVMGILNLTPDSFSGDGLLTHQDPIQSAIDQALRFQAEGADILDIGGESSRPGSIPLSETEELARILPVISAIRSVTNLPISVDTYKSGTARQALTAGANWINDIWAFRADPSLAQVAAEFGCPVVLMHNRSLAGAVVLDSRLGGVYQPGEYNDFMPDVIRDLQHSIQIGLDAGIQPEQIILDPGIGFGKSTAQNLLLINHLGQIKALGYPVLLGPSRKSFIGHTLNLPADQRLEGTLAAVSIGITRGADIIRVHDVQAAVRSARMTDALVRAV
jgi:dihydropteroate synthase